ncbi:hypothetical protein V5R04_03250 [Jonesiaceae bacterium BS-20]|uniref:Uncharacterized protein n=1 Tax=Jonesiaceae bacterium BS-20 TaxID=3120821 RepID=A0AAU7DZ77_9MICO
MTEVVSTVIDPAQILAQFDAASEDATFIDLDNGYAYTIDARLHVYSDGQRWALIGEVLGYNPRSGNVVDVLHYFGNALTSGPVGYENEDFLFRVENMEQVEDVNEPEEFRGGPIRVRGIDLVVQAQPGDELDGVFRSLVPEHRDLLLATEEELRRRIPTDLPKVLRLEEWNQPDLFETPPSASESYRLIAQVLATADASRWIPTLAPNTHWSNWPDSGSL